MHSLQVLVVICSGRELANSAVTIPVGTAKVPQPINIMMDVMNLPKSVLGVMSPNPTVVMVLMAQ
jgi:hypothetical protein